MLSANHDSSLSAVPAHLMGHEGLPAMETGRWLAVRQILESQVRLSKAKTCSIGQTICMVKPQG